MRHVAVGQVTDLIERQLGRKAPPEGLGANSSLEDSGLTSLDVTEVFFEIEALVGVELDPAAAAGVTTPSELAAAVNGFLDHNAASIETEASAR